MAVLPNTVCERECYMKAKCFMSVRLQGTYEGSVNDSKYRYWMSSCVVTDLGSYRRTDVTNNNKLTCKFWHVSSEFGSSEHTVYCQYGGVARCAVQYIMLAHHSTLRSVIHSPRETNFTYACILQPTTKLHRRYRHQRLAGNLGHQSIRDYMTCKIEPRSSCQLSAVSTFVNKSARFVCVSSLWTCRSTPVAAASRTAW